MGFKMQLDVQFSLDDIKQNLESNQRLNNEIVINYLKNKINSENLDYANFIDITTGQNGNKGFLSEKLSKFNEGTSK